jgi:SAM-dependent methyltransferase
MNVPRGLGRRLARLATDVVVRRPGLWRLFRGPLRLQFEGLAPHWDGIVSPGHLDALLAALEPVEPPRRALDLGTGTGAAALAVAERFPDAEVTGYDLSPRMVAAASAKLPPELAGRVSFAVADASALPVPAGSCDLVTLANMIPFFDELARVAAPGGTVVCSFSSGAETPIYVSPERLRRELGARGFAEFAEFSAGAATALSARRR